LEPDLPSVFVTLRITRKAEIERMQAKLRKLEKRTAGSDDDSSDSDDGHDTKRKRTGPSILDQELAKYSAARRGNRKGAKKDEDDVLSALLSFTSRIRRKGPEERDEDEAKEVEDETPDAAEEGLEVDDDVGWMGHALKAVNDGNAEQIRRAETDYTVRIEHRLTTGVEN
jgi:peptidyl-prolyl cis-trans isomerase SDCCAG10